MFNLRIRENSDLYEVDDISTLNDIAVGHFDCDEAERITSIACNMKFHDIYISRNWGLRCVPDKEES